LLAVVYGAILFWTGFIMQHYPLLYKIGNIILFAVLGIITMMGIGSIILIFCIWVKEWLRFNKWLRSHQGSLTCQELCEIASTYTNTVFYARVIKTVREQHLLVKTRETEAFLRKIALEVEAKQRNDGYKKEPNLRSSSDSHGVTEKKDIVECTMLVSKANPEILDELYMLLEDITQALEK
jgi:hypothetical protein